MHNPRKINELVTRPEDIRCLLHTDPTDVPSCEYVLQAVQEKVKRLGQQMIVELKVGM